MKFAKTLSMCASVFALTVVALPVASSAQQQAEPAPAAAAAPAAQTTGTGVMRSAIPPMVSRCMKGIGALLYRLEKCVRRFSMIG